MANIYLSNDWIQSQIWQHLTVILTGKPKISTSCRQVLTDPNIALLPTRFRIDCLCLCGWTNLLISYIRQRCNQNIKIAMYPSHMPYLLKEFSWHFVRTVVQFKWKICVKRVRQWWHVLSSHKTLSALFCRPIWADIYPASLEHTWSVFALVYLKH